MVDASWLIQANSGTVLSNANATPALLNPTQQGSTLFLMLGTNGTGSPDTNPLFTSDPPWFAESLHGLTDYLFRRDNQPAGETSWPLSTSGSLATNWAWRVEEWAGLSTVSNPDAKTANSPIITVGSQTNACTNAGNQVIPDVTDYLAFVMFELRGSGASAFPAARSYTAGFTEADCLTVGTGTATTDFQLIAVRGFPGITGSNTDCVMTFDITGGGGYADKSVDGWIGCYQPAPANPDTGVLTS